MNRAPLDEAVATVKRAGISGLYSVEPLYRAPSTRSAEATGDEYSRATLQQGEQSNG